VKQISSVLQHDFTVFIYCFCIGDTLSGYVKKVRCRLNTLCFRSLWEECQAISELEEFLEAVPWHSFNSHFFSRRKAMVATCLWRNLWGGSIRFIH